MDTASRRRRVVAEHLIDCRLRVRAVSVTRVQTPHTLYWNITEETDEDLF